MPLSPKGEKGKTTIIKQKISPLGDRGMELSEIIPHIESLIFASDRPLNNAELLELVNNALAFIEDRATQEQVDAAIEGIVEKYNSEFYAFEVRKVGVGWQFLTKKEYH